MNWLESESESESESERSAVRTLKVSTGRKGNWEIRRERESGVEGLDLRSSGRALLGCT